MRGSFLHPRRNYFADALLAVTQVSGMLRGATQIMPPRARHTGTPDHGLQNIRTVGPQTHRLPHKVMWLITMLTAVSMAFINFCTIWVIGFLVEDVKFSTMQTTIDKHGVHRGVFALTAICVVLASMCTFLVFFVAPQAGSSGAPENKGWLNGNNMPGLFTRRNLIVRALCTLLANAAGYPVGREGPTVTMGSNIAFLITEVLARPYVAQWVDIENVGSFCAALVIDEERFAHAKRIVCGVGGACGMAMLFDSPIGGIVYMFEEISAASWPLELTFRAFAGTSVCALVSRALLNLCGTNTKAFVVFEWKPTPQPWSWSDMPFFVLLAAFLGPFSALHTRACLSVGSARQKVMTLLHRIQPWAKMVDAVFYAALCALTYSLVSSLANCFSLPPGDEVSVTEFVRYNCKEGEYNPVASLLLTTSEGAVKRLFSRKNTHDIHAKNEFLAFVAYTTLNVCLTGVPVPSGNFTGSMLIGGLAGRIMGAMVRDYWHGGVAVSGVYAMVGSAAMLCGFKQMAVAVVVFITGCCNDLNLIPPLMLSITVSLLLNQLINERGFDEEQVIRKQIPFLPPEPPKQMDRLVASELLDPLPTQAILPPEAPLEAVKQALQSTKMCDFPVVREGRVRVCEGFTTRARLEAAVSAREMDTFATRLTSLDMEPSHGMIVGAPDNDHLVSHCEEQLARRAAADVCRQSSFKDNLMLPVGRLAERWPYTILEKMPAPRLYAMFAKAGARAACVHTEEGAFIGIITRSGLIQATRDFHEKGDYKDEDEDEEERDDEGCWLMGATRWRQ